MGDNMPQLFYDPAKTYEENYNDGPFGDFASPPPFQ